MKLISFSNLFLSKEGMYGLTNTLINTALSADLILAVGGSVMTPEDLETMLRRFNKPVVVVPGTYEYALGDVRGSIEMYEEICSRNGSVFLHNKSYVVDDVRILGTPLWSNFKGIEIHSNISIDNQLVLRRDGKFLKEVGIAELHNESVNWLRKELDSEFQGKTIVASFSPPVINREGVQYWNEGCEELIKNRDVTLWIYGDSSNVVVANKYMTPILSNPRGYTSLQVNYKFNEVELLTI